MKAWFNEKGNWCIEFENAEKENTRFIVLISEGTRSFMKYRNDHVNLRKAYISAKLLNACISTIFISQNYTQSHPTIDNPIIVTSEELARNVLEYNIENFTKEELNIIKEAFYWRRFHEIL